MAAKKTKTFAPHLQRYFLTGVLTVIPIWLTYVVFEFFFRQLSEFGRPWARVIARSVSMDFPAVAEWLIHPWFQSLLAVILTIVALYLLGWIASRVVGKRLLAAFDWFMHRIPLVQTVYGSFKKLLAALQQKPDKLQRVVLIEFPSRDMKVVGFVTRILKDQETGQDLAAIYVPTTPNPTSGYLEIMPLDRITPTDWTIDEAMTFIISGGAVAPDHVQYERSVQPPQPHEKQDQP